MPKDAKINMYRVHKCGYYGSSSAKLASCDYAACLKDLHTWITSNKPTVRETQTFTPGDDAEQLPVFCYSAHEDANKKDFVITTWNETETADGRFAGLHADETAGNASVDAAPYRREQSQDFRPISGFCQNMICSPPSALTTASTGIGE